MLQITNEFKDKVIEALLEQRANYGGTEAAFARQWGMNASVYQGSKAANAKACFVIVPG